MSVPAIVSSINAISSAVLQIGPVTSLAAINGTTPLMDVRPFDGRIPYKFENEDGRRMDDPVSVPKPTVAKFAVTATAVPPDDPAAVLDVS